MRAIRDVHPADGHGDHVGARRRMRLGHDRVGGVLAGADDQPRRERASGDDEGSINHVDGHARQSLPAADEVHDLDRVAVADDDVGEGVALENGEVVLDGDAARVDVEPAQQVDDGQRLVELESFAVQGDEHCQFRWQWTARRTIEISVTRAPLGKSR